jgi:hypothetical protein
MGYWGTFYITAPASRALLELLSVISVQRIVYHISY